MNLSFGPSKASKQFIAWSSLDYLATTNDTILCVYRYEDSELKLICVNDVFHSRISCLKWCNGPDYYGETLPLLFISAENGSSGVFDVRTENVVVFMSLKDDYAKSSLWSAKNNSTLYVGTQNGRIIKYSIEWPKSLISKPSASQLWELKNDKSIDYLDSIVCHANRFVFANSNGEYGFVNGSEWGDPEICYTGKLLAAQGVSIVSCRYFPFSADILLLAGLRSIYLYLLKKQSFVRVFSTEAQREPIIDAFAHPYFENILCIVYQTHIRIYCMMSLFNADSHIKSIGSLGKSNSQIIAASLNNNKLSVYSVGGSIQILEFSRNNSRLSCKAIYRNIPTRPISFDINGNSLCFGSKTGVLTVFEKDSGYIRSIYKVHEKEAINNVFMLAKKSFIYSSTITKNNRRYHQVFYTNFNTNTTLSLLKPSLMKISDDNVNIFLSYNKEFLIVQVAGAIILVFSISENSIKQIANHLEDTLVYIAYGNNPGEFWTLSPNFLAKKYSISSNNEPLSLNRITNLNPIKGGITCMESFSDYIAVGTKNGELILYDWYGSFPRVFTPSKFSITSMKQSPNGKTIFALDEEKNVYLFENNESNVFSRPFSKQVRMISWLDANTILFIPIHSNAIKSFDLMNNNQHDNYPQQVIYSQNSQKEFAKSLMKLNKINDIIFESNKRGFYFISQVLSVLFDEFSMICYGANYSQDKTQRFLKLLLHIITSSQTETLRSDQIRFSLCCNERETAFSLLVTTPPTKPSFGTDVLKASLFHANPTFEVVSSVAASLINGGLQNDAIDLFLIAELYKQAAKLLASTGNTQDSVTIARATLNHKKLFKFCGVLINNLIVDKQMLPAIALLILTHRFQEASNLISQNSFDNGLLGAIVSSLYCSDNQVLLDNQKFAELYNRL